MLPLTGDTLRGEVDVSNSSRAARTCRFRATPTGAVTNYTPEQVRAYGIFNGRLYQAHSVATDHTTALVVAPRFLEVLVQGRVTLYYLDDAVAGDLFYARAAQGAVQPLWSWKETVYDERGGKFVRQNTEFRTTLGAMMVDCPTLRSRAATVEYQLRSLVGLVRAYNQCVGGPQAEAPALANRKSHLNLTAVVGGQASTLVVSDNSILGTIESTSFGAKPAPAVGLALEAHTSLLSSRLTVVLEALYSSQLNEGDYVSKAFGTSYGQLRVKMDQVRVPLMARYSFANGKVRPFIQAGLGTAFTLTSEQQYRFSFTGPPNLQYSFYRPFLTDSNGNDNSRGLENSLLFGVGATTARANARNLALELRGERSNGFSNAAGIATTYTRFFLLLRYDLTK
ncbi:PorT family protein [Hymenobacter sp. BT523]|uniref:outer membrane beta-barrel protein n=1 Tax=Hymenobacter sp. BT523 TaxID=2795725 RepID=UPI0018ED3CBC|nr:outer membrane beta-barrel protein [Hymenobacter sp. BT523]MBJ6110078.1 PorT family protein [Hymenobacter sp. BT523]